MDAHRERPDAARDARTVYEFRERLSSGPVTEVWRACAPNGTDCAVKLPVASLTGDPGAARLIAREREFLERAAQPGVVEVLDCYEADTGPALVTAFLPGGDLVALAGSHPRHWAQAMLDVVQVVGAIHDRGIVHRDLKPRNVRFDESGRATLIDFALASTVGEPCRIGGGTSAYRRCPPGRGAAAQPADDVYALAVMTYELSCGRLPFSQRPRATVPAAERRAAQGTLEKVGAETGARALAETAGGVLGAEPPDAATALAEFRQALQAIITSEHA